MWGGAKTRNSGEDRRGFRHMIYMNPTECHSCLGSLLSAVGLDVMWKSGYLTRSSRSQQRRDGYARTSIQILGDGNRTLGRKIAV